MLIPLRLISHLRMSIFQKLGLAFLFCLGWVVIVLSIARTIRINAGGKGAYPQSDPRWVALWSIAEETTAIVVCCLPAIRKLFISQREKSESQRSNQINCAAPRRFSLRRWSVKWPLKLDDTGAGTRTESTMELETDISNPVPSPASPDFRLALPASGDIPRQISVEDMEVGLSRNISGTRG